MTPLSYLIPSTPVSYHFYADDTKLYLSFDSSDSDHSLTFRSSVLDSVHNWLTLNRQSINTSKAEYLIIRTPQQRVKLISPSIAIHSATLTTIDSTLKFGIIVDNRLSLKQHISTVCKTSYYHIRQLRQIRSSLDKNSAIIVANSLVSTKLDYYNSRFYGRPVNSLDRSKLSCPHCCSVL